MQGKVPLPIRLAGLAALLAGVIFILIQPFHPADRIDSLTTPAWTATQSLKFVMSVLFLFGVSGLYARQLRESGWLGLAGFIALFGSWALQAAYVFANAFIAPVLVSIAPEFVTSWLGIINGDAATVDLAALPGLYGVAGILYLLGGLLFGLATYFAKVFPKAPALLLAIGAVLPIVLGPVMPHPLDRLLAVPVGLGLAWLGYLLFHSRAG